MRYPPPRPLFFAIARTGRSHLLDAVFGNVCLSQSAAFAMETVEVGAVEVFRPTAAAPAVQLATADVLGQDGAGEFVITVHLV